MTMMLFDTNRTDNIVIVPPKPDALLSHHDEFSYSNLYCYEQGDKTAAATGTGTDASTNSQTDVVECGAASTSTSTSTLTSAPSSNVSFDSSVFDAAAASKHSQNSMSSTTNNNASTPAAAPSPSLRTSAITRDPRNGAFTFGVHAEYDLLLHVQKDLDKHRRARDSSNKPLSDVELSKRIMRSFDEYCLQKQWMYHIGSEKGVAIGRFLRGGVESCLKANKSDSGEVKKFICVDLGTYCGYSALVLASTLRQFIQEQQSSEQSLEFHIYTTEVSTKLLNVAQSVFRLAKMEKFITPILMKSDGQESLSKSLLQHGVSNIDFLLLDHAKDLYLNDLQDLENAELLSAGSHVTADNVVFNRLDAYREHIHKLELGGVAESRLEEMNLEYSNNLKDGMGILELTILLASYLAVLLTIALEMTVYLKDPSVTK
ncbi:hypothetical protein ACHAXR_010272 [Thalassiosira sp. AJA248-18]